MKKQQTVFVRNNGSEDFSDRYNGEDFTIAANGGIEEMLVETAELCLGFGQDDKIRCVRRLGWAFTMDDMPRAQKRLASFSFHMTEREALEHDPSKVSSSSAPRGNETGAGLSLSAPAVVSNKGGRPRKLSPLQKLAQAQAG